MRPTWICGEHDDRLPDVGTPLRQAVRGEALAALLQEGVLNQRQNERSEGEGGGSEALPRRGC